MNIGDKILALRKSKGYSQEDIANKLNVSRQTVSKWETNQSVPDFDKIVPLCDLFNISTDELLKGVKTNSKKEEEIVERDDKDLIEDTTPKKKFAFRLSISIFLYFLSIMWIILGEGLGIQEEINVAVFLGICGVATSIIVYSSIIYSKSKKQEKEKKKTKADDINNIISMIFCVVYFIVSFATMAWHITWLIWIIYAIVAEIVKTIYEMEDRDEE